jgi:hypothetical protein
MAAEIVKLRKLVELQAERIAELEKLIEEVRRGGKRQAAPFSKGISKPTRRSGVASAGRMTAPRRVGRCPSGNRTVYFLPPSAFVSAVQL